MKNRLAFSRVLCSALVFGLLFAIAGCVRKPDVKWFPKNNFLWVKIHWAKNTANVPVPDKFVGCVVVKGALALGNVNITINDADQNITAVVKNPQHEIDIGNRLEADGCYDPILDALICYQTVEPIHLQDTDTVETIYSLDGGGPFSTTTCGGGTNVMDLDDASGSLELFSSYSQVVDFVPVALPLCDVGNGNLGCGAACTADACLADAPDCDGAVATANLDEITNLDDLQLALVQNNFKINKFQQWVLEILKKRGVQTITINSMADVKAAIAAKPGVRVAIFGHGNAGEIKIGEDVLNKANAVAFGTQLKGLVKELTLFGCKTGANQTFLKILTEAMQRPVIAWDGKVYAFGNDEGIPFNMRNRFFVDAGADKKDIPTVSEWGLVVMGLMVLAAGTIVMTRRRTAIA